MTETDVLRRLAAKFAESAVERTKAAQTRKGYDTTGIKYAYVVERMNEQLGLGWTYGDEVIDVEKGQYRSGAEFFDVTMKVTVRVQRLDDEAGDWIERHAYGGHRSSTRADAYKGALTNGLKKAAAMFGVGIEAYKGTIDDDNLPQPEEVAPARREAPKQSQNDRVTEVRERFAKVQENLRYLGLAQMPKPTNLAEAEEVMRDATKRIEEATR